MSVVGLREDMAICERIVDAYDEMLAQLERMRADSDDLAELLAIASVTDQVTASRRHHVARLRKMREAEDRAWAANGEAQRAVSGCRDGVPAVEGHGCPALLGAGSAAGKSTASVDAEPAKPADIIHRGDPFFLASQRKELPAEKIHVTNRIHNPERGA